MLKKQKYNCKIQTNYTIIQITAQSTDSSKCSNFKTTQEVWKGGLRL